MRYNIIIPVKIIKENSGFHNFILFTEHKNIKAFVTHGGLMSTQESVTYGVPMVGIPLFGDQVHNVKIIANKKIAVELNHRDLTEKSLTAAVKEILQNPIYK